MIPPPQCLRIWKCREYTLNVYIITQWIRRDKMKQHKWVVCCKNASFKIFFVIPKGLASRALSILLLVWHLIDYRFVICSLYRIYCITNIIPKDWLGPVRQSCFWYDKTKILEACNWNVAYEFLCDLQVVSDRGDSKYSIYTISWTMKSSCTTCKIFLKNFLFYKSNA